jgi:hypothetical protein
MLCPSILGRGMLKTRRPARSEVTLVLALVGLALACGSSGGLGPEEGEGGFLQISAADLDGAVPAVVPAGFVIGDVSSFRIQINAGPRIVIDSTFTSSGVVQHAFELEPDSYVVLIETFQAGNVLLFTGVGEATVAEDDTVSLQVDLDPSLGSVEAFIDGKDQATVATNGSVPVRVVVRNGRGQNVAGARVDIAVEPSTAGSISTTGPAQTDAEGTFTATFVPQGGEFEGTLRVAVDGFAAPLTRPVAFSVVSPVDVNFSSVTLASNARVPADGTTAAEIFIKIFDRDSIPQAGIPVVILSSRNAGGQLLDTVRSDQQKTNAAGEVRATLTTRTSSTLAGDAVISVEADGKRLAETRTISFRSLVNASLSRLRITPVSLPANGITSAEIVAEVKGETGEPLPDVFVRLQTRDDTLFRVEPQTGRTDANGIFRARISAVVVGSTFIDLIADGLRTSGSVFVVFL